MSCLAIGHPEVHSEFMQGGFSVQLEKHNLFGRMHVDQTTEKTVNKDTQTPGGTKGFSLKPGAVTRYYLTSEYRSSYLRQLRDVIGRDSSQHLSYPDLHLPRIKKDESDVKAVLDLMENNWINPLICDQTELVSLSTGIAAPTDVARDLLTAHMVKEEVNQNFKKDRLESEPRTVKFHDKMKKQNLKTFSDIKTKHTGNKAQDVILKV